MNNLDDLSADYLDRLRKRFWAKVEKGDDCWEWRASVGSHGYGQFTVKGTPTTAHRVAWILEYGPIPRKHVIDHLCRNSTCVNPDHLDAVKQRVNFLRGDHEHARAKIDGTCASGSHLLEGDNIKPINGGKYRTCRACYNENRRQRNARQRAQGLAPT